MQVLADCKPERLFHYFEEISAIPRRSGDEKAVSDYVVRSARDHGLWAYQDTAYNVLIRKPAFTGYEQSEPVLLQAHLDMVCEKNNDSAHDFSAGSFLLKCSVRSSVYTKKRFLSAVISRLALISDGTVSFNGDYPGWEFVRESPLRALLCEVFKELYGKPPEIAAIHGGLECGLLTEKVQGMDAVAIGPDICNAHTPRESVSIASVKRTWEFILASLKRMR
ncbi:MAG: M20/M25/M40 family metallo-hydrolase [Treponema sp.]|jgi:di/tripeptidase|nr:M20/M25/M40 family metallo-hydrolase [Treponema sp.]